MARRAVDNSDLVRWRAMDAAPLLVRLADNAKCDSTYKPSTNSASTRWHAVVAGADYEMLCTGPKFFDTRAGAGGCGAVDMAMYLFTLDFKSAVSMLRTKGL